MLSVSGYFQHSDRVFLQIATVDTQKMLTEQLLFGIQEIRVSWFLQVQMDFATTTHQFLLI